MHKRFMLFGFLGVLFMQGCTDIDCAVPEGDVVKISAYALKKGSALSSDSSLDGVSEGHAWISIENISSYKTINISGYTLQPGTGMTVSTWNKKYHAGVWINVEQLYPSTMHISTKELSLNEYQAGRISTYIDDHNKWDMWNSDANFTSNVWNLFADTKDQIQAEWIGSSDALYRSISRTDGTSIGQQYPINSEMGYIAAGRFKAENPRTFMVMDVG